MEYKVFARKYRPQNFYAIIGQDHIAETLKNSISTNRIGHAFLFTGPRGVGKTTTARILAKALNCVEGPVPEPCNECDPCKEITSGGCIDVIEIDGASNRGIDEIRDLKEKIRYTPIRDRYKVYIIDEVHMLTKEAFNALLKTLEEPPGHAKFIFATTEIHKVPSTIQSRCQRFDFKLLSSRDTIAALQTICEGESIKISDKSLRIIAQSAAGSLRDAESLLEKVVSFSAESIGEDDILPLLGLANPELLHSLIRGILEKDVEVCFSSFDQIYNSGADVLQFYAQLRDKFRMLLMIKVMKNPATILDTPEDELSQWDQIINQIPEDDLYSCLRILVDAETDMRLSLNPRLTLELIFYRMLHIKKLRQVSDLIKSIQEFKHDLETGDGLKITHSPAKHVTTKMQEDFNFVTGHPPTNQEIIKKEHDHQGQPEQQISQVQDSDPRKQLIEIISNKNLVLSSYLEVAEFSGPEQGKCMLSYTENNRFAYEKVLAENNLALLKKVIETTYGAGMELLVTIADQAPDALESGETKHQESDDRRKKALKNPVVKKTIDLFNGEITDID